MKRNSYFAQIMKKILVYAISLFRTFLLNFEKQFQEMNESKIKPIRAQLYSDPLSPAHLAVLSILRFKVRYHLILRQFGTADGDR